MDYQSNRYITRIKELGFQISFWELDDYIQEFLFARQAVNCYPAKELVIGIAMNDIADADQTIFIQHCRDILQMLETTVPSRMRT
jgi:hypothetical protein